MRRARGSRCSGAVLARPRCLPCAGGSCLCVLRAARSGDHVLNIVRASWLYVHVAQRHPVPKEVAARLDQRTDSFFTRSGRKVALTFFVEPGKLDQVAFALAGC